MAAKGMAFSNNGTRSSRIRPQANRTCWIERDRNPIPGGGTLTRRSLSSVIKTSLVSLLDTIPIVLTIRVFAGYNGRIDWYVAKPRMFHESFEGFDIPLSASARRQPCRLVSLGRGSAT